MSAVRISVITAVLNRARTLEACLKSVEEQTHADVEHVVMDGGSTDGSLEILRRKRTPGVCRSQPDGGAYEALNAGIAAATGDVIGVLGSDDVYAHPGVLSRVAAELESTRRDACYGDLVYVSDADPGRVVRTWRAGAYRPGSMRWGWMPPHPTLFVRRELLERLGGFERRLRIAADYELMLRLVHRHGIQPAYVPEVLVIMRTGGLSNAPGNLLRKTREDVEAWRMNGLRGARLAIAAKNLRKLPQVIEGALLRLRAPGSPR